MTLACVLDLIAAAKDFIAFFTESYCAVWGKNPIPSFVLENHLEAFFINPPKKTE